MDYVKTEEVARTFAGYFDAPQDVVGVLDSIAFSAGYFSGYIGKPGLEVLDNFAHIGLLFRGKEAQRSVLMTLDKIYAEAVKQEKLRFKYNSTNKGFEITNFPASTKRLYDRISTQPHNTIEAIDGIARDELLRECTNPKDATKMLSHAQSVKLSASRMIR